MHGTSRIVLRASLLGLLSTAAVAACSDDGTDEMEYQPGAQTYPEADTGASSSSSSSSGTTTPGDDDDDAAVDAGATGDGGDGGDSGDGGDAGDAGDATADADAGTDAGNDPTLGAVPLSITFAGLGVGDVTKALTIANFAGNDLNAWTSTAGETFEHGTTVLTGTGSATAEIAWGQWSAGMATDSVAGTFTWPVNGGAIYVVGQNHAGAFGALGQLNATFVGATPVISASGASPPGTATGNAGLYEGVGAAYVGFNATITLGADTYSLGSTGGFPIASTSELVLDASAQFSHTYPLTSASAYCMGSCNATVQGFVGGANGEDIALVIHIYKNASGEAGSVSAGLAFTLP